jgi:hypothetical protein
MTPSQFLLALLPIVAFTALLMSSDAAVAAAAASRKGSNNALSRSPGKKVTDPTTSAVVYSREFGASPARGKKRAGENKEQDEEEEWLRATSVKSNGRGKSSTVNPDSSEEIESTFQSRSAEGEN